MSTECNDGIVPPAIEEGVYFNNTKLVYSSNQDCIISNIPVVDPGLQPLPPGTIVYIEGIPSIEDGIYVVPIGAIEKYERLPDTMSTVINTPLEALEDCKVYVTGVATTPDGVYTLGYNAGLGLLITEGNALDIVPNDDYEPGISQR
ncbi:hypothetical protein [Microcoleus phage My-WqHQDG]|nr:hypothetical protein [Microcoleus phage My-WqHQDG]